ncbi:MAG: hypothetical protein ACREJO_16580, partial [Phycisphaerales bacterium]
MPRSRSAPWTVAFAAASGVVITVLLAGLGPIVAQRMGLVSRRQASQPLELEQDGGWAREVECSEYGLYEY